MAAIRKALLRYFVSRNKPLSFFDFLQKPAQYHNYRNHKYLHL